MAFPTHGPEYHERLGWTAPCRAATTANITISTALIAAAVLDGVTLAAGDRVLVKDQSTGSQNGIYVVAASPARAGDYAVSGNIVGSVVMVSEGTANLDTIWQCTTNAAITVGTTALAFLPLEVRRGSGTATVVTATTTITVTHGAGYTPAAADITVCPTNSPTNDPGHWWVDTIGATTFAINVRANPGASGAIFAWRVAR